MGIDVLRLKDYQQALDGVVRIATPSSPYYVATPSTVLITHKEFLGGMKDYLDLLAHFPFDNTNNIFHTQPPTFTLYKQFLKIYMEGIHFTTADYLTMPPFIILTDDNNNKIIVRYETYFPFTGEINEPNNIIVSKINIRPLITSGIKPLFNNTYSAMAWCFINGWEVNWTLVFDGILDTSLLNTILPLQSGYEYKIVQRGTPTIVGDFYNNKTQITLRTVVVNG